MMGKTHIFIGTATALVLTNPQDTSGLVTAIIGGALGGIVCDVDTKSNSYHRDAFDSRVLAAVICACMMLVEIIIQGELISTILEQDSMRTLMGVVSFLVLCVVGYFSKHRGFTHSIIGLILFTIAIAFISQAIVLPFIVGFISHIALDVLNKQGIRVLFPSEKSICLKICYADKIANNLFLALGIVSTIGLIARILIK